MARKPTRAAQARKSGDARADVLVIRVSSDERALLDRAAKLRHLPTGTWVRALALDEARRTLEE